MFITEDTTETNLGSAVDIGTLTDLDTNSIFHIVDMSALTDNEQTSGTDVNSQTTEHKSLTLNLERALDLCAVEDIDSTGNSFHILDILDMTESNEQTSRTENNGQESGTRTNGQTNEPTNMRVNKQTDIIAGSTTCRKRLLDCI